MREVFRSFAPTGSAFTTVRHFRQQHLLFPRRLRRGAHRGELVWAEIEHHDVLRLLHHPAYAGAYVYGRTRTTKTADGKLHLQDVPHADWVALVRDAHVGYISWEDFERNEAQLALNSQAYAPKRFSPPREGPALEASSDPLWMLRRADDGALSPAWGPAPCPRLVSVRAEALPKAAPPVNAFLGESWTRQLERCSWSA